MSIAVTVVVAPSRWLRLLAAGFGACLLAAAVAAGPLPHVLVQALAQGSAQLAPRVSLPLASPSLPQPRFSAGPVVAGMLLFAGVCLLHAARRPATVHRIDISGPGQIRLTVQQELGSEADRGMAVTLLPGSTVWPRLMLLRFGPAQALGATCGMAGGAGRFAPLAGVVRAGLAGRFGRIGGPGQAGRGRYVVVLPDSVMPDEFRALTVALGAAAGQGAAPVLEREIL